MSPLPSQPPARRAAWRLREREWGWLCAGVVAASLLFTLWPALDLIVSGWFWQPDGQFSGNADPVVMLLYPSVPWFGRAVAVGGLMLAWLFRHRVAWLGVGRWRRMLAVALVMLLGAGVLVNGVFKAQWGRPRPHMVSEFGGTWVFQPALQTGGKCRGNCSFVSGHSATGYALMGLGMMGAARTRRRWLGVGLAAGLGLGVARITQGGHFLSDVVFAGLVVWATHLAVREVWLRLAARRRARWRAAA